MIRVLQVGPDEHARGGIASVIQAHARYLTEQSVSVRRLATVNEGNRLRKFAVALRAYIWAPLEIMRTDIVHVHTASRNSWRRKMPLVLLAKFCQRHVVIHIHGGGFADYLDAMRPWHRRLTIYLLSRADCIVSLSAAKRAELARHLDDARMVTIPNPCRFVPEERDVIREEGMDILFAGWIEQAKGVFDLIRAFASVVQECPDQRLRLVMAGKGKLDACRELARECGIEDRVVLPGWMDPVALQQAYARAVVYCLPSYVEGLPMGLLEAMAFGLPIVTCPVGGIPDVIDDGIHGLLVSPGDVKGITVALRRLIVDQTERATMGAAGRARVLSRYAPGQVCGQLCRLYASLLAGPRTGDERLTRQPNVKVGSH